MKKDILDYAFTELKDNIRKLGYPSYRAGQMFEWLYGRKVSAFSDMKNLPHELREKLAEEFFIGRLAAEERVSSKEGCDKFLFRLKDGSFIESVLIPAGERRTLCLSTQVGCRFACPFCASGKMGFKRNLRTSEITGQITGAQKTEIRRITNVVFMGMGEPLDNLDNLIKAIYIMSNPKGFAMGARRITVSTCGLPEGIRAIGRIPIPVNLSISLHASYDKLRDELVPANRIYPLKELLAACREYLEEGNRKITLEYALIKDKNISKRDASALIKIAKRLRAKVNLIPLSRVEGSEAVPPSARQTADFRRTLKEAGVPVTLRRSEGGDINAACGQLAGKRPVTGRRE